MNADEPLVPAALRQRAEALLRARQVGTPLSLAAGERLLHELQVHQIELELQNEELVARRGELEASLARYTDLYDFAPVGYATLAAGGTLIQANLAGAQLLGSARERLAGKRLAMFVVEHDRRAFREWLAQVFAGSEPLPCQLRLLAIDAAGVAQRTVQIDGKLSSNGDQCLAVLIDVSQRLAAEAANRALELQLRHSQKMEAIGTLTTGIAHDFNNILAVIFGGVLLVRQDIGEDHVALVSLEKIQQASQRARSLVQQMLVFGRKQEGAQVRLELQTSLEDVLCLLQVTLPPGVQLQASLGSQPLYVLGDATQLHQVVMNLCTNAWQSMPAQAGRIELQLDAVLPGMITEPPPPAGLAAGRYARLSVHDNGCGMDGATLARVFEPFFTTKDLGSGTGLGLSVVHGIVTGMGGVLNVHSTPGQGSRFEVWLPLLDEPVLDNNEVAPLEMRLPVWEGPAKHVVYVDDHELMLHTIGPWLQRQGYRVSVYADPLAALEALRLAPMDCDIVVTDFNMPGLSGLALAEALRALRPDLPIVLSSGYASEALRRDALRCGVREVVHKEDSFEQLGAVLWRLLAQKPG
jgi:PAS domain S-box-containing protein